MDPLGTFSPARWPIGYGKIDDHGMKELLAIEIPEKRHFRLRPGAQLSGDDCARNPVSQKTSLLLLNP
jgi:hypothetical protein